MKAPFKKVLFVLFVLWQSFLICGNGFSIFMTVFMAVKNHDLRAELIEQGEIITLLDETVSAQKKTIASQDKSISLQDDKIASLEAKVGRLERENDLLGQTLSEVRETRDLLVETNALHRERIAWLKEDLSDADEAIASLNDNLYRAVIIAERYKEAFGFSREIIDILKAELSACQAEEQRPRLWSPRSRELIPFPVIPKIQKEESDMTACAMR